MTQTLEQLRATADAANVALAAAERERSDALTARFVREGRDEYAVPLRLFAAGFRGVFVRHETGGTDWDSWEGTYTLTTPSGEVVETGVEPAHGDVDFGMDWVAEELTRRAGFPVSPSDASALTELNERVLALL